MQSQRYNYWLLDIIHHPDFYLKRFRDWTPPPSSSKKPIQLGPINRAGPYLEIGTSCIDWAQLTKLFTWVWRQSSISETMFLIQNWTMDTVRKVNNCINIPSSQSQRYTFKNIVLVWCICNGKPLINFCVFISFPLSPVFFPSSAYPITISPLLPSSLSFMLKQSR
jgi:hypothetical protein